MGLYLSGIRRPLGIVTTAPCGHCEGATYIYNIVMGKVVPTENISRALMLKLVAADLQYPTDKGIVIKWIKTHSLSSRGVNALALARYSAARGHF